MDALALLCHLAADGTTTFARLRHAGYESLQDVLLVEDEELEQVLDLSLPLVRRMRRQAESLEDRMGEAAPDDPDPVQPPLVRPETRAAVRPGARLTPLLCRIESESLTGDERPTVHAEESDDPLDPGPSGPFA